MVHAGFGAYNEVVPVTSVLVTSIYSTSKKKEKIAKCHIVYCFCICTVNKEMSFKLYRSESSSPGQSRDTLIGKRREPGGCTSSNNHFAHYIIVHHDMCVSMSWLKASCDLRIR